MTTTICEAAALHAVAGLVAGAQVPVGHYDLSGVRVVITLPDGAAVERSEGTAGNGLDRYTATSKGLSLAAILLFLHRSGCTGPGTIKLWQECIAESIAQGDKAEDHYPAEALEALAQVKANLASKCQDVRRTQARRIGLADATIEIE